MHSDFSDELFHCEDISSQAHEVLPETLRHLAGPVPGKKLYHEELPTPNHLHAQGLRTFSFTWQHQWAHTFLRLQKMF